MGVVVSDTLCVEKLWTYENLTLEKRMFILFEPISISTTTQPYAAYALRAP